MKKRVSTAHMNTLRPPSGSSKTPISRHAPSTEEHGKTRQAYSQSVYKSRFTHFRILRHMSFLSGILIFFLLCVGLWRLYIIVFHTIEDTEYLLFIEQGKRTEVIDFKRLEQVRTAWEQKHTISTTTPRAIFGTPIAPSLPLDNTRDTLGE